MNSDKTTDTGPAARAEKTVAAELEHFEKPKCRERQAYLTEDMPDELFDLIVRAEHGKIAE